MMFFLGLVVFDHVRHRVWIVRNVFTEGEGSLRAKYQRRRARNSPKPAAVSTMPLEDGASASPRAAPPHCGSTSNFTRAQFLAAVRKSKEYIRAGDIFQVVVSQRFSAHTDADPFEIYRALRVVNPSPYMYFLKLGDTAVVGSSPEMLLKVQGREAFYRPIAGTRPRGGDEKEDQRLAAELAADPKERAEHIMLVDLGRNDLGRVSEYGSVRVERLMFVERYSHVMHLVSSAARPSRDPMWTASTRWPPAFPAGRFPARPKFAPWKSSTSSSPRAAASTPARFSISIFPAISIPASPFAPWS